MRVELVDARSPEGLSKALRLLSSRPYKLDDYVEAVKPIVEDVRSRGYQAVKEYSERFDGVSFEDPIIEPEEAGRYYSRVPDRVIRALREAVKRVYAFQESIKPPERVRLAVGLLEWVPVDSVGAYVPGGRHPYPSTAVMTVVPARAAGVRRVHVSTPPCRGCDGLKANPVIVTAAFEAGADSVIAVGGPQAIAAMAYGCEPVPRVDMIVGPGSGYVQAAKLLVSSVAGIDMVAGPTELAVVAGCHSEARVVALELAAQAEHGPDSLVALITPCEELARRVAELLSRVEDAEGQAVIALVGGFDEALRLASAMAPEHLYLDREASEAAGEALPAGVVSVDVPTAYLDYVAGPSHVLPTGGAARWRSGLSVYDFLRPVARVTKFDPEAAKAAVELAESEGFRLHAESLRARMGAYP